MTNILRKTLFYSFISFFLLNGTAAKEKTFKFIKKEPAKIVENIEDNETLTLKEVIKSAQRNYPKILALYQEVEAAKGSILAAQGFFDVKLRQSFSDRTRGYYDGKTTNSQIVKNNKFLGSEVYGGYRRSFGSFENHETGNITNQDGEFMLGARFSLLRNATIDENRLGLILSKLDLKEAKFALKNIKNEIRRDTTKAYYDWVILGKIYNIYKELYQLALVRNNKLAIRVKQGDLAKIILTENQRNALSRKTSMIKAKQDFENAAIYLSLFYRDENAKPLIAKIHNLPEIEISRSLNNFDNENLDRDLITAMQRRADLNIIKIAKDKARSELKYAKNLYKPKLDLEVEASNDIANNNQSRGQSKNKLGLKFEIPLQQRKAKGAIAKANSKISKIKYEETLLRDTVNVTLQQLQNNLNNIVQMHDNLTNEVSLSLELEKAERTRFDRGGSDFFLINLREQQTASAKIENTIIFGKYYKTLADYNAEIFAN